MQITKNDTAHTTMLTAAIGALNMALDCLGAVDVENPNAAGTQQEAILQILKAREKVEETRGWEITHNRK